MILVQQFLESDEEKNILYKSDKNPYFEDLQKQKHTYFDYTDS